MTLTMKVIMTLAMRFMQCIFISGEVICEIPNNAAFPDCGNKAKVSSISCFYIYNVQGSHSIAGFVYSSPKFNTTWIY